MNTAVKPKILIVEDEMLLALSLKKMLQKHFSCEDIACSVDEAKSFLTLKDYDLVLIDITLQGKHTGLDLADYIYDNKQIPFIFTTALTDNDTLQKIISKNPAAYLSKPLQIANTVTAIELALLNNEKHFKLEIGKQTYHLQLKNFLYAEADHIYINLFFEEEKKLMLRTTLSHLEEVFPVEYFRRINRSIAVNPKKITQVSGDKLFINQLEFKTSRNFSL